jgi:hypothetical protein
MLLFTSVIRKIFSEECQIMKLVIMQSYPLPCYLVSLRPKYILQRPTLENSLLYVLPTVRDTKFHTHTKQQARYWSYTF